MANPSFISETLLHWMGQEEGWEVINQSVIMSHPQYDAGDDGDQVQDAAIDLAGNYCLGDLLIGLPVGTFVVVLQAGEFVHTVYHGHEGTEYDMEVETSWHNVNILSDEDKACVEEREGLEPETTQLL